MGLIDASAHAVLIGNADDFPKGAIAFDRHRDGGFLAFEHCAHHRRPHEGATERGGCQGRSRKDGRGLCHRVGSGEHEPTNHAIG